MAQDERPVEITANAICCGVVCQFATFHADDPELAAPVVKRVCNGGHDHGAAGDNGAATKQRNSRGEHVSGETRQPIALGPRCL
jgi:hypothetical protein